MKKKKYDSPLFYLFPPPPWMKEAEFIIAHDFYIFFGVFVRFMGEEVTLGIISPNLN